MIENGLIDKQIIEDLINFINTNNKMLLILRKEKVADTKVWSHTVIPPKALVSNSVLVNNADMNDLVRKERYLETIPETVRLILNEYLRKR